MCLLLLMLFSITNICYSTPISTFSIGPGGNLTIREALTKASQQQMLSQRIAKVYLAINNNLTESKFYIERDEAIQNFQKNLDELKLYTPSDKIKTAINHVRTLWDEYKEIANWSINRKGAGKLVYLCDEILLASNQLVHAYEEYAKASGHSDKSETSIDTIHFIKTTGVQRMLTQRIMLLYLAAKQDIEQEDCIQKLDALCKELTLMLSNLSNTKTTSPAIQKEIAEIQKYWQTLSNYLKYFNEDPIHVNSMLFLSDELTKKADALFQLITNEKEIH